MTSNQLFHSKLFIRPVLYHPSYPIPNISTFAINLNPYHPSFQSTNPNIRLFIHLYSFQYKHPSDHKEVKLRSNFYYLHWNEMEISSRLS
jgi:hypothetical protein